MSQSGFTPIKLYASSTALAVPLAANLDNTNGAELAVNTADEKLYLKNSSGVVKLLASNAGASGSVTSVAATVPSFLSVTGSPITTSGTLAIGYSGTALPVANGGTGQTSQAAAFNALSPITTTGDLILGNGTNSATRLAIGANGLVLTSNGTTASWVASPGIPGGSNTQVQFNNSGAFGGSSGLTWDGSSLTISGAKFGAYQSTICIYVGSNALASNTTGVGNQALGASALLANTTGSSNQALGNSALANNVSGSGNVAIGVQTLLDNISGNSNTAIGAQTLLSLTSGSGNIGIGSQNSSGTISPVFTVTTQDNRIVMGSTAVTNAYIQVAWTVVSDLRDKAVLGDVPHGLEFVKKLKPIKYKFKESRDSDETVGFVKYGFGAQDILALEGDEPVIVDIEQPEKLKLTDQHLLPIFSNAIKELAEQVEQLKAEIAELKAR